MTTAHVIGNDALVSHAFNGDGSQLAISVNTSDVYLLRVPTNATAKYQILDVLHEHTALVTGLDWAPKSDRIVSCSADRNAYVWTKQCDGKWKPTLVVLMIDRAAICVRWSPLEDRFAVGSGCKLVAVCCFDKELDWWTSKHIKKHFRSTVTCLDWHPNNSVLACGSSDFHMRVYSAHIKSGDTQSAWGNHSSLGDVLFEHYECEGGWVLGVSFSADGNKLVWTKHNSLIFVADVSGNGDTKNGVRSGPAVVTFLRTDFLPFISCLWVGPSTFITAGYDCCPIAFKYTDGTIQYVHKLDVKSETKASGKFSAMKKFQDIDRMATTDNVGSRLPTVHQNCINELRLYRGNRSDASRISSIGRDGYLVFWDLPSLCQEIAQLSIA
ncbi:Actin protein 2/3 complex subunit [Paragonimus heterotremus]|uniref:Actin-related protein 2/3 complex subunit n=1 Tax=Paragonimus heterotremus TaxID=100268 RepID=A0A8J4WUR3_9TREM|nr:Actin protein 2/3 complex subunit [Paragonimus heterotremus]